MRLALHHNDFTVSSFLHESECQTVYVFCLVDAGKMNAGIRVEWMFANARCQYQTEFASNSFAQHANQEVP